MEDVLEVYKRPYDPHRPVLCVDETSRQLLADTRPPQAPQPARPARQDYEYQRNGTANLFMVFEPLVGWRQVPVTQRRTKQDWARLIRDLLDGRYAAAERVVLVQDNLNVHTLGALYETFPPAEARRLAAKLELHYTPKHGSWLNMAEIEFSALARATGPIGQPRRLDGSGRRLGDGSQPSDRSRELAFHHHRCSHQTQTPLPFN